MSKIYEIFIKNLGFDVTEYIESGEHSDFQKKIIKDATFIMKDNIVGDVKKFGGNLEKNKEKLENFIKKADEELGRDAYKESQKELKDFLKDYLKNLKNLIEKTCIVFIPVKEMPWIDVIFRSFPRIYLDEKKKPKLIDNTIAYYGEVKCVISKTTIYGKMKDAKPLFAPVMGELDLGGFQLNDQQKKDPKSKIYPYISAIIKSLDTSTTKNHLAKYHEGYQRHGEPICDFLMKENDLLNAMEKITSAIESKRIETDIAITGIAVPQPNDKLTLLVVVNEAKESESDRFAKCFEGLLRFSAACCEEPSSKKGDQVIRFAEIQGSSSKTAQPGGTVTTPGGQELKVWTAESLADDAQRRGTGAGAPPGLDTWSEEDLLKAASERGSGVPEGMEMWTEDGLAELSKKRQGGLDIPEWKPEEKLPECLNCGYGLRKGWAECPICNTPAGAKAPEKPTEEKTPEKPTEEKAPEKPTEEKAPEKPTEEKTPEESDSEPTFDIPD